jgi:hypothetical protein
MKTHHLKAHILGSVIALIAVSLCFQSCQLREEYPCDYGTHKVIYVTELGTNNAVPGADVFLTQERPNNGVRTVYHCTTNEQGMAHWPCAIDYTMLCVEAGDDYWEYCPSQRVSHAYDFLEDDIYELTTKSIIRIHVPYHYLELAEEYGYLLIYSNGSPLPHSGETEYGRYYHYNARGAKENLIFVAHYDVTHAMIGSEMLSICPPARDTLDYFIPIPK